MQSDKEKRVVTALLGLMGMIVLLAVIFVWPKGPSCEKKDGTTKPILKEQNVKSKRLIRSTGSAAEDRYGVTKKKKVQFLGRPEKADIQAQVPKREGDQETKEETIRRQAVETWDALIDRFVEQSDKPSAEQALLVKEAFDKLDKSDQADSVHRALNLLSDEQFPVLYGILFDKKESEDILDAIFSDALNRSEDIKNPLMKELRKDREHPMFFESARILDVVEPDGER